MAREKKLGVLSRERPSEEDIASAFKDAERATDRHASIILSTQLEGELGEAIEVRLPRRDKKSLERLYSRDGPLASFYSKIELASALAIIDEDSRSDLHDIRGIRNAFAHARKALTFETPQIAKLIGQFKFRADDELLGDWGYLPEPRRTFVRTVFGYTIVLIDEATKAIELEAKRLTARAEELEARASRADLSRRVQRLLK